MYNTPSQPQAGTTGEKTKKYSIAAVLVIIGLVLLIASLFLPWYIWEMEIEDKEDDERSELVLKEDLRGGEYEATYYENGEKTTERNDTKWKDEDDEVAGLYTNLLYITIISVILGGISLAVVLMAGRASVSGSGYRNAGFGLCLSAGILALVSVMLLVLLLPQAHDDAMGESLDELIKGPWDSFWGSDNEKVTDDVSVENSWHPYFGWFLGMIGGVLFIAGGVTVFLAGKAGTEHESTIAAQGASPSPDQLIPQQMGYQGQSMQNVPITSPQQLPLAPGYQAQPMQNAPITYPQPITQPSSYQGQPSQNVPPSSITTPAPITPPAPSSGYQQPPVQPPVHEQYHGYQPPPTGIYGSTPGMPAQGTGVTGYESSQHAPEPLQPTRKWQCPNCGSQVSMDYIFCDQCGTKRG